MKLINKPGSIVGTTVYFHGSSGEPRTVLSVLHTNSGITLKLEYPCGYISSGNCEWYSRTIDGPRLTREDIGQ